MTQIHDIQLVIITVHAKIGNNMNDVLVMQIFLAFDYRDRKKTGENC